MTNAEKVAELESLILYHNHRYYDLDDPEISDHDYDQIFNALQQLNPESEALNDKGQATYGEKYTHKEMMGSLSKAHTDEEVFDKFSDIFPSKTFLVAMDKIDGMSMSLHYRYGKLIRAVTRGDGYIGEIVTDNARQLTNIPLYIEDEVVRDHPWVEVRGEAYVNQEWYYANKERLEKEEGRDKPFKNPRNYTAGSVRHKDAERTKKRHISFVAYKILYNEINPKKKIITSFWDVLNALIDMDFEIPYALKVDSKDKIADAIKVFDKMRKESHYDTDGVVFMIDDLKLFDRLGYVHKYPKGAIAYKFETDKEESVIRDIEWNTGRTGKITPVAVIDPIELAGTTVTRLTLNNLDYIQTNSVMIGDTILVEKANEIIPKLVKVVLKGEHRNLNIPVKCPSCSHDVSLEMPFIMCNNPDCPAKLVENIEHFLKKLDVKGISDKTIEKVLESGIADDLPEMIILDEADLVMIGFGNRQAEIFVEALRGITATPEKFLGALGVDGAGSRTFTEVVKDIPFKDIINSNFTVAQLCSIEGIAETSAEKIKRYFDENQEYIHAMLEHVSVEEKQASSDTLNGKTFCITGTLSRKRKEVESMIEDHGGVIKSVSKTLDYLVAGEDAGSKLDKAKKLGVSVLTENELYNLMK